MKKTIGLFILFAAVAVVAGGFQQNQNVRAATAFDGHDVTLEAALRVLNAAVKKSEEMDVKMNITILDAGGNLKAFVRMDDAFLGSADISMKKAKTSRLFNAPSGAIGGMSQPGGPLYGIESTNGGLVTFAGGLPLANADGKVIGSIGVSGSSVENDLAVAQAGVDSF